MVVENAGGRPAALGTESGQDASIVRLFILSDVRLLCEGLVLALAQHPSVTVVGASDLSMSPAQIAELRPDVLLLDIAMHESLNISVALRQVLPNLKIVAIAVAEVEQEVIACAEAGVSGFVSRKGSAQDVVAAVHCAVRGELVCSRRTAALLFSRVAALASMRSPPPDNGALTRREHEIVSLLNEGLSNKEIARQLRIQSATVKNHIHSILGKLQVRRRGEVAAQLRRAAQVAGTASPQHWRPHGPRPAGVLP
jgi:two-component system, NarL family, nitrate/nitrite response regulator NarL